MNLRATVTAWLLASFVTGCVHRFGDGMSDDDLSGPIDVERVVEDALDHPTRVRTAGKAIAHHQASEQATFYLLKRLEPRTDPRLPIKKVRAGVELYLLLPDADAEALFATLIRSARMPVRRVAWQVAAMHPSDAMAEGVSRELSQRAGRSKSTGLSPEAALAARANDLKDAYPLLRSALEVEGQPAYAKAMAALRPTEAADDLLTFLGAPPAAAILRGDFTKTRRSTVIVALGHLAEVQPSLHHPAFRQLFAYVASTDQDVAAEATDVLLPLVDKHAEHFAFLLAAYPETTQETVLARLGARDPALADGFAETLRGVRPSAH